ncbi:MAG TPA: hypothetical protein VKK79_04375, partial [Candidatus Lokiarchaeia archaeon]|nr:hypothetical protein [Candidatus Lokiarchaeia archaeon]
PAPWGAMPDAIAHLVSKNASNVDNVVEAALSCDRNKLVQAIMGEPSCYHLAEADVAQCVDVLLAEQRGWLPEGWYR